MFKTIALFILLMITFNTRGQTLNDELSKLLFGVDLRSLDSTLIDSFSKIGLLEKINRIDTTILYYKERHTKYFYRYPFKFKENKYIKVSLKSASVDVVKIDTAGNNIVKTRIDLWLVFNNSTDLETTYKEFVQTFSLLGISQEEQLSTSTEELTVISEKENKKIKLTKSSFSGQLTLDISNLY